MPLQSMNPATGEVLREFAPLDEAALRARLALAADAAVEQRGLPMEHRVRCLRKLAAILEDEVADIARVVALETGKPVKHAQPEVLRCADCCRFHADNAGKLLAPERLPVEDGQAYLQPEPVGVVLVVMPWNSPLWHALRLAVPALAAGNAVLLRHAASVPQSSMLIETLARRAGFARGAVLSLLLEDRAVETVLADERVAAVNITGNESAGRAVAAQAGWLMKKCTVQMPGGEPMIVMPSCDLDKAAAAVLRALAGDGGARRVIVHSGVYTDFVHRLVKGLETLRVGDPLKDDTDVGPLGTASALNDITEQVKAAVSVGGRVVAGGTRLVDRGYYFEPTILSDVPRNSAVAREALARPLCLLFRASDMQDSIQLANASPFQSSASVWTQEPAEQQAAVAGVNAALVALNALPEENARMPLGSAADFLRSKTVFLG